MIARNSFIGLDYISTWLYGQVTMLIELLFLTGAAGPELTLSEAAALAAGGAPAVERALAETDAARASRSAARAALWPTLTADLGFLSSDNPVTTFSLALEQERFSAQEFFQSDPNNPPFTKDWTAAVGAAWAIDLFGSARAAARSADSAAEAAAHAARRTGDGAALEAIDAFVAARRADETLAILAERERDAENDASIARALFDEGVATEADPARSRAALAEVRAQAAETRAAATASRAALAVLIGETAASRPLAALPAPEPPAEPGATTRDDVAAAELAAEASADAARSANASRWPALLVTARYELHAPTPGGRYGDSATVFGGFRMPIFTSGAISARVAEARAREREARAAADERRRTAHSEVVSARARVEAAAARWSALEEASVAARRAREIQQARYEEGAARLSDLLDARAAELTARIGSLAAASDRVLAEASLRMALGLPPAAEETP
jgi:multidrug efflux system outer membrane protein